MTDMRGFGCKSEQHFYLYRVLFLKKQIKTEK